MIVLQVTIIVSGDSSADYFLDSLISLYYKKSEHFPWAQIEMCFVKTVQIWFEYIQFTNMKD